MAQSNKNENNFSIRTASFKVTQRASKYKAALVARYPAIANDGAVILPNNQGLECKSVGMMVDRDICLRYKPCSRLVFIIPVF